jgi:hypothetical protein
MAASAKAARRSGWSVILGITVIMQKSNDPSTGEAAAGLANLSG